MLTNIFIFGVIFKKVTKHFKLCLFLKYQQANGVIGVLNVIVMISISNISTNAT